MYNRVSRADISSNSTTPPISIPNKHPAMRRNRRLSLQPIASSSRQSRSPSPNPSPKVINWHKGTELESAPPKPKLPTKSYFKILILGNSKVGKTCLIHRFLYNNYSKKYHRTVEELHSADFTFNRAKLTLDIIDTSGNYEFPAMLQLHLQASDAFIIMGSIIDNSSIDEIPNLRERIINSKGVNVPIVFVLNKIDEEESLENSSEAEKTRERLEEMARKWNHGFVECSAKSGDNVTQVFKELLIQAKVQYRLSPALKKRRQSLPGGMPVGGHTSSSASQQLQINPSQLKELRASSRRTSCIIS